MFDLFIDAFLLFMIVFVYLDMRREKASTPALLKPMSFNKDWYAAECVVKGTTNKKLLSLIMVVAAILVTQAYQPPAYAGELELGRTVSRAASHTVTYIVGLEHKLGPVSLDASYLYGETDDLTTTDQGYLNLIYDQKVSDKWSIAGGNKIGFNNVRGIDVENFLGAGPKYYIIKDMLSFSMWYLHQYTNYADRASATTRRMSYRLKLSVKDGDTEARAVFYYQPSLSNPDDYITRAEASYRVALSDTVQFKISYKDEYRSLAEGVQHETLEYITITKHF